MKEELLGIQETAESMISGLKGLMKSVENGQIPFAEQDYFNLAIALERVKEAKDRMEGIISRK